MVNTGLLILTNPSRVGKLLSAINKYVLKTLYIQYFPDKNILITNANSVKLRGPQYSKIVANIYTLASSHSNGLDVRVLLSSLKNPNGSVIYTKRPIELVIFDRTYSNNDANTFMQDCLSNTSMGCEFITFDEKDQESSNKDEISIDTNFEDKMYKNVVLGGTFDRLHNGHKIFLSEAILRSTEKLTIGVTDANMIEGKILWEMIEPCSERICSLKNFTEDIDPCLTYNIVPITDIYGPTKDDPAFEMIIVSEETKKGADIVNEKRKENNLNILDIYIVKLAEDPKHEEHEETKISSSNNRIRLLGNRIRKPNTEGKDLRPYIIGLTGGIASGKSSIADKLKKLGAGLVNCDLIAHSLYAPGMKCNYLIAVTFGPEYINPNGQVNRRSLSNLVFNDLKELDKLNDIMWPEILEETKRKINDLYRKGFDIVVVEAAVLIQAGWQPICHEIWTCIIPQIEAESRLMQRNNMILEEARKRILVQPSNIEQINNAHVVISTLWSHEVTQQQVQKAWDEIIKDLEKNPKS